MTATLTPVTFEALTASVAAALLRKEKIEATPVGGESPTLRFHYHDHFGYVLCFREEVLTSYQAGSEEAAARHFLRLASDADLLSRAESLTPEEVNTLSSLPVVSMVTLSWDEWKTRASRRSRK